MPECILSKATSIRRFLVSAFFADVTQQIHSFLASGVIWRHRSLATVLCAMAIRKSAGIRWTVPPAIVIRPMAYPLSVQCQRPLPARTPRERGWGMPTGMSALRGQRHAIRPVGADVRRTQSPADGRGIIGMNVIG